MLGLSVMRVIQMTLAQFPPCDPAEDTSHARLWTSRGGKRTDREGHLERGRSGASGGDTAENISIRGERC